MTSAHVLTLECSIELLSVVMILVQIFVERHTGTMGVNPSSKVGGHQGRDDDYNEFAKESQVIQLGYI